MSSHDVWRVAASEDGLKSAAVAESSKDDNLQDFTKLLSTRFNSLSLVRTQGDVSFYIGRQNDAESEDRLVGLKVLSDPVAADPRRVELFRTEAVSAAKLSHKNIVKTDPPEEVDGIHFSTIEHRSEAETLKSLLDRKGWLDLRLALLIVHQIADALEHAHECGVLHLGIQPENVLVEPDGLTLLTDFGLTDTNDLAWAHTQRSSHCPSHYTSPEQASGGPLDRRSDLYSLGIVFYQMLTDRLPVNSEDPSSIRGKHITQAPLSPHLYLPEIPLSLSDIVVCLLEKDPARRFQDIASFRLALDKAEGLLIEHAFEGENPATQTASDEHRLDEAPIDLDIFDEVYEQASAEDQSSEIIDPLAWQLSYDDDDVPQPSTKDLNTVRKAWETPSIEAIEPPVTEIFERPHFDTPPRQMLAPTAQLAEKGTSIDALPESSISFRSLSNSKPRPVLLVILLTIITISGLIILARADRGQLRRQTVIQPIDSRKSNDAANISPAMAKPDPTLDPAAEQPVAADHQPSSDARLAAGARPSRAASEVRTLLRINRSLMPQRFRGPKRTWRRPRPAWQPYRRTDRR